MEFFDTWIEKGITHRLSVCPLIDFHLVFREEYIYVVCVG